jgi:hypothetical protein
MNKRFLTLAATLPLIVAAAPSAPDPLAASFHAHVAFLADDLMQGRAIGSPGHEIAANYIAQHFARNGLTPAGDVDSKGGGTWFQRVNFIESRFASERETAVIELGSNRISLENGVGMVVAPGNEAGP